ncbi:MAG TPA: hypothetical protein VJ608_12800, partial [Albitalea sp.]|nr:hypothetical protein [Albitalea sp.]
DRTLYQPSVVYTEDGDGSNTMWVGRECFKKIAAAGEGGYQPPLGGPRLFLNNPNSRTERQRAGL